MKISCKRKPATYLNEIAAECPVLVFTGSRLAIIVLDNKQKKISFECNLKGVIP